MCFEAYIRRRFFGVGDNRGPKSDGGTYKTSIRFSIAPKTGKISGLKMDIGKTKGKQGTGELEVGNVTSDGKGGWSVTLSGTALNGEGVGPKIDFNVNVHVDGEGGVSMARPHHNGFPSYELWSYQKGADPRLVYSYDQGGPLNALRLFGGMSAEQGPSPSICGLVCH